jgi:hypothetical protein
MLLFPSTHQGYKLHVKHFDDIEPCQPPLTNPKWVGIDPKTQSLS